ECAGSAATARAAIYEIRRLRPDAVILDLRLTDGSGFDVLRALRDEQPMPAFYVLSSLCIAPHRRPAMRAGVTALLDKAMDMPAVRDLLVQRAAQHRETH